MVDLHEVASGRVSIRTPRAGRDLYRLVIKAKIIKFLSTRPGRGATASRISRHGAVGVSIRTPRAGRDRSISSLIRQRRCFYPHAPGGARLDRRLGAYVEPYVSIRTPRAGRDLSPCHHHHD